MGISRVASAPAEAEIDPHTLSHSLEGLENAGGLGGAAEFGVKKFAFVDPCGGRVGLEVVGMPGDGEGIVLFGVGGRVEGSVEGDGSVEFFLADIALYREAVSFCPI